MTGLFTKVSKATILLAILALTGCALFNREVDNIKVAPTPKIVNKVTLTKTWHTSVSGDKNKYSLLGPIGNEQWVYIAARNGQVRAVNRVSGNILWTTDVIPGHFFYSEDALLSGGLSLDKNALYVGSEKAVVYAIHPQTGALLWQKEVAGEVLAKPVITDKSILIHTSNGYLQALDKKNGAILWETNLDVPPLSLRGQSAPIVRDNQIIIGDDNGHINALSLQEGLLIWQQSISQPKGASEIARLDDVDMTPVIFANTLYAIGYNGDLVGLNLHNGQPLWHRAIGSIHNLLVTDQVMYVADQNDVLKALRRKDGSLIWTNNKLKNRQLTNPIWFDDYLGVGDSEGYFYLIDPNTGQFIYKTLVDSSGLLSTPIVIHKQLIIQAKDGTTQAYILVKG